MRWMFVAEAAGEFLPLPPWLATPPDGGDTEEAAAAVLEPPREGLTTELNDDDEGC